MRFEGAGGEVGEAVEQVGGAAGAGAAAFAEGHGVEGGAEGDLVGLVDEVLQGGDQGLHRAGEGMGCREAGAEGGGVEGMLKKRPRGLGIQPGGEGLDGGVEAPGEVAEGEVGGGQVVEEIVELVGGGIEEGGGHVDIVRSLNGMSIVFCTGLPKHVYPKGLRFGAGDYFGANEGAKTSRTASMYLRPLTVSGSR